MLENVAFLKPARLSRQKLSATSMKIQNPSPTPKANTTITIAAWDRFLSLSISISLSAKNFPNVYMQAAAIPAPRHNLTLRGSGLKCEGSGVYRIFIL